MSAPTFTRRKGDFCDVCDTPSLYVARAEYDVHHDEEEELKGRFDVCATCAATLLRVAMEHEVAR